MIVEKQITMTKYLNWQTISVGDFIFQKFLVCESSGVLESVIYATATRTSAPGEIFILTSSNDGITWTCRTSVSGSRVNSFIQQKTKILIATDEDVYYVERENLLSNNFTMGSFKTDMDYLYEDTCNFYVYSTKGITGLNNTTNGLSYYDNDVIIVVYTYSFNNDNTSFYIGFRAWQIGITGAGWFGIEQFYVDNSALVTPVSAITAGQSFTLFNSNNLPAFIYLDRVYITDGLGYYNSISKNTNSQTTLPVKWVALQLGMPDGAYIILDKKRYGVPEGVCLLYVDSGSNEYYIFNLSYTDYQHSAGEIALGLSKTFKDIIKISGADHNFIAINEKGFYLNTYDSNSNNYAQSYMLHDNTNYVDHGLCETATGRLIIGGSGSIMYTGGAGRNIITYNSLPVTGAQAKEYVRQFKAYVQSLKT